MYSSCPAIILSIYSKNCVKRPLSKATQIGFQDQLSLNAGQTYCRMLQEEHSAIPLIFIKLPFVIEIFVLSIFEWPFYTGFTEVANFSTNTRVVYKYFFNIGILNKWDINYNGSTWVLPKKCD